MCVGAVAPMVFTLASIVPFHVIQNTGELEVAKALGWIPGFGLPWGLTQLVMPEGAVDVWAADGARGMQHSRGVDGMCVVSGRRQMTVRRIFCQMYRYPCKCGAVLSRHR